jgi:hypothetical protein
MSDPGRWLNLVFALLFHLAFAWASYRVYARAGLPGAGMVAFINFTIPGAALYALINVAIAPWPVLGIRPVDSEHAGAGAALK